MLFTATTCERFSERIKNTKQQNQPSKSNAITCSVVAIVVTVVVIVAVVASASAVVFVVVSVVCNNR